MLNLITNTSAATARRNLSATNASLTRVLEKLSSGYRVNRASDDVAAMAIGSRLNAELTALKTVAVNTGQAISLLQIAEGTYARINDMLVRLKSLTAQAGSGTLSNTERALLDVEFSAIIDEIERVGNDTTFNGTKILADVQSTAQGGGFGQFFYTFVGIIGAGVADPLLHDPAIFDLGTIRALQLGIAGVTFNTINPNGQHFDETYMSGNIALQDMTAVLTDVTGTQMITLTVRAGETITTAAMTTSDVIIGPANPDGVKDFNFRVGTGSNAAEDVIAVNIRGVTAKGLGLKGKDTTGSNLSIATVTQADAASKVVTLAIDKLITARAQVGAAQNRIETASTNLSTTIENTEAAKSSYLDADIAAEITQLTAKQILLQSGISTLAQANQVPQKLLALFEQ